MAVPSHRSGCARTGFGTPIAIPDDTAALPPAPPLTAPRGHTFACSGLARAALGFLVALAVLGGLRHLAAMGLLFLRRLAALLGWGASAALQARDRSTDLAAFGLGLLLVMGTA